MKSAILFLLALLLSTPAVAQTSDAELHALLERVERALANPGSAADREAAARSLTRAAAELERSVPTPARPHRADRWATRQLDECIALGTEALSSAMYASSALEHAMTHCRAAPLDADVLRVAYETFRKDNYAQTSFAQAVEFARNEALFGKADLLAFAAQQYAQTQYPRSALGAAARVVGPIAAGRLTCVSRAFDAYAQTQYAATALENAARTCREP